jgi:hypothetical protein
VGRQPLRSSKRSSRSPCPVAIWVSTSFPFAIVQWSMRAPPLSVSGPPVQLASAKRPCVLLSPPASHRRVGGPATKRKN